MSKSSVIFFLMIVITMLLQAIPEINAASNQDLRLPVRGIIRAVENGIRRNIDITGKAVQIELNNGLDDAQTVIDEIQYAVPEIKDGDEFQPAAGLTTQFG